MREVIMIAGLALTLAATIPPAFGSRHHRLRFASEARIQQSQGNMPAGGSIDAGKVKTGTPEGGSGSANVTSGSPSAPVTCNQQNASSPACYSATQQSRPVTK